MTLATKNDIGEGARCTTPVVLIIYNRPRLIKSLINRLREVQPSHLLILADGPKMGSSIDMQACALARTEIEKIDWPCTIDRNYAEVNLGCRQRVITGLNWVFDLVDRAIILEDDIDPHPYFFTWVTRLLPIYERRDDVAMLCGHNPLVRWPTQAQCSKAIPSRRGGIYGWATWRNKWQAIQQTSTSGEANLASAEIEAIGFEPALGALFTYYLEQARKQTNLSWDVEWTLKMALSRRIAIVCNVNLIHNLGLGADATHTKDGDDLLFFLPRPAHHFSDEQELAHTNDSIQALPIDAYDPEFDRARVLLELMVRTRNPVMAKRLSLRKNLPLESALRLHLLPFLHIEETRHWIDHIASEGVDKATIERWRSALTHEIPTSDPMSKP
jgi:hypothetical protein